MVSGLGFAAVEGIGIAVNKTLIAVQDAFTFLADCAAKVGASLVAYFAV